MRLFAQDLTTDTLQHIAARGLSEAGGPKPLLLRVLVDLFVTRPAHNDDEIQHFAEIAHSILPSATRPEIDHAAMRLCNHPAAPGELVDLLASRGGEGALLLLEKCRRLSTPVIQNAAASGPCEAALALAGRRDLDAATIDLLAARPEGEIALALARNESAPLHSSILSQLVARAQDDGELASALAARFPHRAECLCLFLAASRANRLVMISGAKARAGEMDTPSQALEHGAETLLRRLEAAAAENAGAFETALAQALACSEQKISALAQDKGGELLIIALRALGAEVPAIASILQHLDADLTEGQLAWRKALASSLSRQVAAQILEAMTGQNMLRARHQPLHDQAARESGIRPAPLTSAAEQKLQQSLSA